MQAFREDYCRCSRVLHIHFICKLITVLKEDYIGRNSLHANKGTYCNLHCVVVVCISYASQPHFPKMGCFQTLFRSIYKSSFLLAATCGEGLGMRSDTITP